MNTTASYKITNLCKNVQYCKTSLAALTQILIKTVYDLTIVVLNFLKKTKIVNHLESQFCSLDIHKTNEIQFLQSWYKLIFYFFYAVLWFKYV